MSFYKNAKKQKNQGRCPTCREYDSCRKTKNVKQDTNYCQWSVNRYKKKG